MSSLWFDLRYTLRILLRSPGFSALCVLVIALALGLSLTIYVLVSNQGLKPIPLPNGERYVALQLTHVKTGQTLLGDRFSPHIFNTIEQRSNSYEYLAAANMNGSVTISDGEVTEDRFGSWITPRLLQLTGVIPIKGRNLADEDALPGAELVTVISYQLWQNYYAARDDIVGHKARIEGEPHTIVGVLPEGFRFPTDHYLWLPLPSMSLQSQPGMAARWFTPIAILKQGVDIEEASREFSQIMKELATDYPDIYGHLSGKVVPYIYAASGTDFTMMIAIMLSAAFAILLLACLNVGNLLLIRANERSQELVIRSAMGGSRGRIIRQVLLESFLICLAGGGMGLWLGSYGAEFVRFQTEAVVGSTYLPFWMSFEIGADVIMLAVASTVFIWLLAGGIPAWRASKLEINSALSSGAKGVAGKGSNKVAKILVATEVVCSFFLLVLSGAFVSAVHNTNQIDYGVEIENYIVGRPGIDMKKYHDDKDRFQYTKNLRAEIINQPGVADVGITSAMPGRVSYPTPYSIEDRALKSEGVYPEQMFIPVSANYLPLMGVSLLAGRHFDESDTSQSGQVVIVEQAFADKMWPGESPLGKRIEINPESNEKVMRPHQWVTIVGVVSHVDQGQSYGFERYSDLLSIYMPLAQTTPTWLWVVVKYANEPQSYQRMLKKAASRADRDIVIRNVGPIDQVFGIKSKILGTLSELFVVVAMIALVLAGTGIYGVVSRTVLLRTYEMGIRRALGLTDSDTIKLFLRQGVAYLFIGAVIGGGGGLLASNLLAAEFPNLLDSIFSIAIIVLLTMTALVLGASYLPARKMVAIEPSDALHHE